MGISPEYVIVGATDLARTESFLACFGLEGLDRWDVPPSAARGLFGIDGAPPAVLCGVAGCPRGQVLVVAAPMPAAARGPFDARPVAIDLYTADLERSLKIAEGSGGHVGERVTYSVGPVQVAEVEVTGPDGLTLVLIEANLRRPTILDDSEERLHSEVHSAVWSVPNAALSIAALGESGLQVRIDTEFGGDTVARLMDLPCEQAPVRFVLLAGDEDLPVRIELIEFLDQRGAGPVTDGVLTGGLFAAGRTGGGPVSPGLLGRSHARALPGGIRIVEPPSDP